MPIDVLLLLALPAAGKSEIRTYLEHLDPAALAGLGLGPQVHLDDYPYVHLMRVLSRELRAEGRQPVFFEDDRSGFLERRDWLTLTHLLDEDFAALGGAPVPGTLLDRFDRARAAAGADPALGRLPGTAGHRLLQAAAPDVPARPGPPPAGSTVVIEFARGGPEGSPLPLPEPLGYRASLARLSPALLRRAAILYVWVTPEESRRRNRDRARPGPEGDASILHHGVPDVVMRQDYGADDLLWLMGEAGRPGAVVIRAHGDAFEIPAAVFDNREDRTSFLRQPAHEWPADRVAGVHDALAEALGSLERA